MICKKILHLTENLAAGGAERQLYELLKGINRNKFQPVVATFEKDGFYESALRSIGVPVFVFERKQRWDLKPMKKLKALVESKCIDIIHTWGFVSSLYGTFIAREYKIPLINGSIRGSSRRGLFDHRFYGMRFLLRFADLLVSNSESGFENFGIPHSSKRIVIYNGFDLRRSCVLDSHGEIKKQLGVEDADFIVTMAARIQWTKDFATFIQCAKKLKPLFPKTIYLIVGDGSVEQKNALETLVDELGLSHTVRFLGFRKDVEKILKITDIFVHTTFKHTEEGTPNSLMEAMAMQVPVVATNSGGVKELMADHKCGFMISPESLEALAAKVRLLLEKPEMRKCMGLNGRKRIEAQFSIDTMINRYEEVYSGESG